MHHLRRIALHYIARRTCQQALWWHHRRLHRIAPLDIVRIRHYTVRSSGWQGRQGFHRRLLRSFQRTFHMPHRHRLHRFRCNAPLVDKELAAPSRAGQEPSRRWHSPPLTSESHALCAHEGEASPPRDCISRRTAVSVRSARLKLPLRVLRFPAVGPRTYGAQRTDRLP